MDDLVAVLSDAGLSGQLSWSQIDATLTCLERYRELADNKIWSVYLALGERIQRRVSA